jgi:hypothetical protein
MKLRAFLFSCALISVTLGVFAVRAAAGTDPSAIMAADRRGEEQTFLTYPEWFLVFSPAEYAKFVRQHRPDEFCFWGHIGQFWRGYAAVINETRLHHEPTNWGYHVMIAVIGVSTTVEYAVRSAYETVVGRTSAALAGKRTAEDEYAAHVAQDYVDFIRIRPWYEFNFTAALKGLWKHTDLLGPSMLRKWERRYALTTEYSVKAVYGWLIEKATHSAYNTPLDSTSVVVDRWPLCERAPPGVTVVSRVGVSGAQLMLPRYEAFTTPAVALAHCGAVFQEIAGNRTVIVVSAIGAVSADPPPESELMMRQPIITQPGRERLVLIVPVAMLAQALRAFDSDGLTLEHIFDY